MKLIKLLRPKLVLNELLLGASLGTGYMTSLRFLGPIGISEVLMFLVVFQLLLKNNLKVFTFSKNEYGAIKLFMFATTFIILPLVTFIFYFLSDLNSQPMYILSFIAGCVLAFLLAESIAKGFNMANASLWFAIFFILTNLFFPSLSSDVVESVRYQGAANNPNQLVFYASSLTLLLIIYNRVAAIVAIPFIIYIMIQVKSDAYSLSLVVTLILSIILTIIFKLRLSKSFLYLFFSILLFVVIPVLSWSFKASLIEIWLNADEGNLRTTLMYNALIASLKSPIFGYGAGSFSSLDGSLGLYEAHNTFLDFSMEFGFLFPLVIYFVFTRYFIYKLESRRALDSAFFVAFIISGLFHFSGRHFVFWVELGVFMSFIYFSKEKNIDSNKLLPN